MNAVSNSPTTTAEQIMWDALRNGRDFANEYPLVFGENSGAKIVTTENTSGQIASTCAALLRTLKVGTTSIPVGFIGSVATRDEDRGQGYASDVLHKAETWLAEQGALMAVLWANDAAFYERRGYLPMGTEYDFIIEREHADLLPEPTSVRRAELGDFEAIHRLYRSNPNRVERTLDETRQLMTVPDMNLLVRERHGEVVAYAARGRGEDLQQVMHEWAGECQDVLALSRAQLETIGGGKLIMMTPSNREDVARFLLTAGIAGIMGILGMGKVISLPGMASFLTQHSGEGCTFEAIGNGLRLTGPTGNLDMEPSDALLAVVPPRGERGVVEAFEQLTGGTFPDLPFNAFVWGLDSI